MIPGSAVGEMMVGRSEAIETRPWTHARRVSRKVIETALRRYCQEWLDGETVASEVAFLAGCIAGWPGKDKSIYICFA